MLPKRPSQSIGTSSLLFILDIPLRRKIQDAIEAVSLLYLSNQGGSQSSGLVTENRRTIILYSASIIEALLLYLYKRKGSSIMKSEYANVHVLPQSYQFETGTVLVIAKQRKVPRHDRELMLDVLLKFFVEQKLINVSLKKKIERTKNVRNTFHLSKSRTGIQCSTAAVESSFEAVLGTIKIVNVRLSAYV